MKKAIPSIDIAKFIFSICIVVLHSAVHTELPGILPYVVEKVVLRIPVPFFFVVSGYFLGKKLKNGDIDTCVIRYVLHLLPPFLVFGTINTVLEILKMYFKGYSYKYVAVAVIKHTLFYPYGALWYVSASMIGAYLLIPFLKRNRLNLALVIGGGLYCWALLCNNYYFLTAPFREIVDTYLAVFITARNGVFVGFFMLAIGIKMSSIEIQGLKVKGLTILFFLLYVLEIWAIREYPFADDGALYIMQLFFIPCFVIALLQMPVSIPEKVSKYLRILSTGIYFQHRMWLSMIELLQISQNKVVKTGLTIAASILVCVIVQHIDAKKN